jgi:hypothetical protein
MDASEPRLSEAWIARSRSVDWYPLGGVGTTGLVVPRSSSEAATNETANVLLPSG